MVRSVFRQTEKDCRRRQRELEHTLEPRLRAAIVAANKDWCALHAVEVDSMLNAKVDEYQQNFKLWFGETDDQSPVVRELHDQTREALWYRFGAWGFILIEAACGSLLASLTFNGTRLLCMVAGALLALLLGVTASAIVTRWVRHDAALQPRKQMHRITWALGVLGITWLIAAITALTILRGPEAASGAVLFWVAMTLMTLLSPLCSALAGACAELLSWSQRVCRNLVALRCLARELELLECAGSRTLAPQVTNRGAWTGTAILIALLCGTTTGRAAVLPVYVYVDVSPSTRSGEAKQVLRRLANELSAYAGTSDLEIVLTPFFESAFTAEPLVQITLSGQHAGQCQSAATEIVSISRSYAEGRQRQCDEWRAQSRKQAEIKRAGEIGQLITAIDRLDDLKSSGRCTAVNAIVKRAVRERPSGVSIVISDLVNSCPSPDAPSDFRAENQTFLIPISSREHSVEERFDAIQAKYGRNMPWVQVIEPFRLQLVINAVARAQGVSRALMDDVR